MKALVSGGDGFKFLSKVLIIMLQTLLQDRIAEVEHSICQSCLLLIVLCFDTCTRASALQYSAVSPKYGVWNPDF